MKSYIIQSPCYKANGLNGTYYSIAFADENGDILDGFGDHISDNSYGVKNVFKAVNTTFSDDDRLISINEVEVSFDKFIDWLAEYNTKESIRENWFKTKEDKFGNTYDFLYKGSSKQQRENQAIYDLWMSENPTPESAQYYGFLKLANEKN